uniref:Alternative protein TRIM52 n=1 Tax=Homo sapiens TaxID=9606 RepID=L0R6S5_HUMAN|nr:alternative protein TRIM52 [Homo sapiens]
MPLLPAPCRPFRRKRCVPSAWITSRTPCPSAVGTTSAEGV